MVYRFCRICGGELEEKDKSLLICKKSGHNIYRNPVPCNSAILKNENGEILLTKRKVNPKKGWWDLPGGFTGIGENMEESMMREIKEELGVRVTNLKYLVSVCDSYEFKGDNYETLLFIYTGVITNPQNVKASDDVSEIKFMKPDDIKNIEVAFPVLNQVLKKYIDNTLVRF